MEVLLIGPRPEGLWLVDAAQKVAEAGCFRSLDATTVVAVLLHLGPRRAVQQLVDVDAGGAAYGGVEGDHAAAVAGVLVMMMRRRIHGTTVGRRRRARDVEVDLGAVFATVGAGRLGLLVQVDQLGACLSTALKRQYLQRPQAKS
jgi:hypothetical protein